MRTLGLIGGMSWESTAIYYRAINESVRDALGANHSASLLLHSFDFEPIKQMQAAGEWDALGRLLGDTAARLELAGARAILICANTMHKVADVVAARISVPLIHLTDVTAAALLADGHRKVALLGTRFTMQEAFYRERLAAHGVEALVPGADEIPELDRIIFDELCRGRFLSASRDKYRRTIAALAARGAEAVVLGCTELVLLVEPEDTPLPLFDTAALHARAAVDFALGQG